MSKTATDLVAEARKRIQSVTADELARELQEGNVTLVDLREQDERERKGVIAGAIHVPRGVLEFAADPADPDHRQELQFSSRLIIYCAAGGRSALAADTLQTMGYTNVAHLDGGVVAWKAFLSAQNVKRG